MKKSRWHSCNVSWWRRSAASLAIRCPQRRVRAQPRTDQLRRRTVAGPHHQQRLARAVAAQIQRRLAAAGKCFPARLQIPAQRQRRNALDGRVAARKTLAHPGHANRLEHPRAGPHAEPTLQTVIVMIVARNVVEEFLGQLGRAGVSGGPPGIAVARPIAGHADRRGGAWIYPAESRRRKNRRWLPGGMAACCRIWRWLRCRSANAAEGLKEQLLQMAWAGEMEGWLTSPPQWHLVADARPPPMGAVLRAGLEQPWR